MNQWRGRLFEISSVLIPMSRWIDRAANPFKRPHIKNRLVNFELLFCLIVFLWIVFIRFKLERNLPEAAVDTHNLANVLSNLNVENFLLDKHPAFPMNFRARIFMTHLRDRFYWSNTSWWEWHVASIKNFLIKEECFLELPSCFANFRSILLEEHRTHKTPEFARSFLCILS